VDGAAGPAGVGVIARLLFVAMTGCVTTSAPEPTNADVAAVRARWPDTDRALLSRGRTLYLDRCSACHALYAPADRSADAWPDLVARMSARAALAPDAREAVTRYLVAAASVARR